MIYLVMRLITKLTASQPVASRRPDAVAAGKDFHATYPRRAPAPRFTASRGRLAAALLGGAVLTAASITPASASASGAIAYRGTRPVPSSRLAAMTAAAGRADMAASARARVIGKPVVVASRTTETSMTVARPDGSFASTTYLQPARVKVDGRWRRISTTLRRAPGGSWQPRATPSRVVFSGGGRGPLATLTSVAGATVTIRFPRPLPAPDITGPTATYRSAYPGADLQLTATMSGGLTVTWVIRTARAAASPAIRNLRLGLAESGLAVHDSRAGVVTFASRNGVAEFTSSASSIWDSRQAWTSRSGRGTSTARGPGSGARQALVRARATASALTLTPQPALLTGHVSYPVYVQASVHAEHLTIVPASTGSTAGTASANGTFDDTVKSGGADYTEIKDGCKGTSFWDNNDLYGQGVGWQHYDADCGNGGPSLYRALYDFGVGGLDPGMQIQTATLEAWINFGADFNCSHQWPMTVHWLTQISKGTTWSSFGIHSNDAARTNQVKPGPNVNSSCNQQFTHWDVTGPVTTAAGSNYSQISFGLWGDETKAEANLGFMRVGDNPDIVTVYDRVPQVPAFPDCTTAGECVATCMKTTNCAESPSPQDDPSGTAFDDGCGATRGWISQNSAHLQVDVAPNIPNESVRANYTMWDNQNGGAPVPTGVGSPPTNYSDYLAGGGETFSPIDATLQNGHQYGWRARANVDGDGNDVNSNNYSSDWTVVCGFNVDLSAPVNLAVSSTDFPPSGSGPSGKFAGQSGTFTFSAHDVVPGGCNPSPCLASNISRFLYSLNTPIPTVGASHVSASANSNGSTATGALALTPSAWGTNTLYIEAEDNAGNTSQPVPYTFYVPWNPSAHTAPGDVNGDGIPDLLGTTSTDLDLFPGNADPHATPVTAGATASSPDGTAWNTFQITHRGSMIQQAVDDVFAHKASNLYIYLNNPLQPGAAPQYNSTANLTTVTTHPACSTSVRSGNCSGYPTGNWSDVSQILAPGDAWTGSGSDNHLTSLITVENGQLWLYQGLFGNALGNPVLLGSASGTTNWSGMTLIAPGTVGSSLALWARNNSTGAIYSFPLVTGSDGLPTLNPASPGTPVAATSGTVITGISLNPATYPAVASPGPLNNSAFPGLYAEQTTGTLPSGASCAGGCLWFYPGQSTSGGAQPLNPTPVFVGILSKAVSQLS